MEGFYKQNDDGVWLYAPTAINNKNYTLRSEDKDTYELPIDGWDWYDESPIVKSEFELWEERMEAILDLKNQSKDSPLDIPTGIFYEDNQLDISDFIKSGDAAFLNTCETSDEKFLDLRQNAESPSPREILIAILTPLVIIK